MKSPDKLAHYIEHVFPTLRQHGNKFACPDVENELIGHNVTLAAMDEGDTYLGMHILEFKKIAKELGFKSYCYFGARLGWMYYPGALLYIEYPFNSVQEATLYIGDFIARCTIGLRYQFAKYKPYCQEPFDRNTIDVFIQHGLDMYIPEVLWKRIGLS